MIMEELEQVKRMIEYIEYMTGSYGIWDKWSYKAIRTLYYYVCFKEHGKMTTEDYKRIGVKRNEVQKETCNY